MCSREYPRGVVQESCTEKWLAITVLLREKIWIVSENPNEDDREVQQCQTLNAEKVTKE